MPERPFEPPKEVIYSWQPFFVAPPAILFDNRIPKYGG